MENTLCNDGTAAERLVVIVLLTEIQIYKKSNE